MDIFQGLRSRAVRYGLTVGLVFFLFCGQGLRYLVGLPVYGVLSVVLLTAIVVSFWGFRRRLLDSSPVLLTGFILVAGVSLAWTLTPVVSVAAFLVLLATTASALFVARGMTFGEFLKAVYRGLQLALVGSLLFELVAAFVGPISPPFNEFAGFLGVELPSVALEWSPGSLLMGGPIQGLPGNRNLLGFIALLVGILSFLLTRQGELRRRDGYTTLGLAIATHFLTGSATVVLAAIAVSVLLVAGYSIRRAPGSRRRFLSWTFVGLAALASYLAFRFRDNILVFVSRDPDLTNRTDIWLSVFDLGLKHPLGTGWVSYWPVWEEPYRSIMELGGVPVSHAHNALLDVWLQLGPVGALLLLGLIVTTLIAIWETVEDSTAKESLGPLIAAGLLTALVIQSISESRLLLEGNWFLLVVLASSAPQFISNRGHSRRTASGALGDS